MRFEMRKYHNVPCEVDGIRFDSKKEASRYQELLLLEKAGEIQNLRRQVPFEVCPAVDNLRARKYIADFVYIEKGEKVIEDVKSPITKKNPLYTLKKQLVLVNYPDYEFRET